MPDLLTPHDLQQRMLVKSGEVDAAIDDYRRHEIAHVEADRLRRLAYNTAILTTEGTVAERTAKAEKACEEEIYAQEMAEALRNSAKEALRARLAQLNALQSLTATVREEMRLAR